MMKKPIVLKLFLFALFLTSIAPAKPPFNVGDRRQVFIDGRLIGTSEGIKLVVHRPHRTGEIVLRCDQPWEERLGQYHSVLKDGNTKIQTSPLLREIHTLVSMTMKINENRTDIKPFAIDDSCRT